MAQLEGKVALVTGASAGIGKAAALALAAEGAAVLLTDVDEVRGPRAAQEIETKGGRAAFVAADVTVDDQVASAVAEAVRRFGGLDIAYNNAGIEGEQASTHEMSADNWQRVIAVNLTGVWTCMRHEIPVMLDGHGGSIINCSSVAGLVGFGGIAAYTASKHGVVGLTKAAALDYATTGIRVNAICPGVIDTEMITRFTEDQPEVQAALLSTEPVGRMGAPEEIADAVVWLASSRSSFVTGQAIAVDGGFVTR